MLFPDPAAGRRMGLIRTCTNAPETEEKWEQTVALAREAGATSVMQLLERTASEHVEWARMRLATIEREKVSW